MNIIVHLFIHLLMLAILSQMFPKSRKTNLCLLGGRCLFLNSLVASRNAVLHTTYKAPTVAHGATLTTFHCAADSWLTHLPRSSPGIWVQISTCLCGRSSEHFSFPKNMHIRFIQKLEIVHMWVACLSLSAIDWRPVGWGRLRHPLPH